jgi:hypothetical protein
MAEGRAERCDARHTSASCREYNWATPLEMNQTPQNQHWFKLAINGAQVLVLIAIVVVVMSEAMK